MDLLRLEDRLPQCSRCRGDLLMSGVAPQDDEHGRSNHLELCRETRAMSIVRRGLLVQWFANDGGHDMGQVEEGAHLLME
ncbi:DUF6300 family protein [Streptomyces sp. 1222.5]|uniref:DUF6300 family protein n=1 Tax=Streptomyces sp. 1222.5 TaxID=1881026 RepID=UPI003EB8BE87